ncbi:hypothetical protein TDB9533_04654 [Thalassocella blandensis]|nr:hypothetical protein TDB9533_04654 [Thalassocella blandensis]
MGSASDKVKGKINETIGKGKQGIGEATGNHSKKSEGKAQELKGKGQQAKGDAKEKLKKAIDKA